MLAAVKKVLADPRYRAAAQRLAQEYQAVDSPARCAGLIEAMTPTSSPA